MNALVAMKRWKVRLWEGWGYVFQQMGGMFLSRSWCVQGRRTTTLIYEDIICEYSFFWTQNEHMDIVRMRQKWLRCTHSGETVQFFCLSVSWCQGRNISRFIWIFGHPCCPCGHKSRPPVVQGYTSCLLCHPRNFRSTSKEEYLHPVYFRKQVHIFLRQPRNLRGNSAEASSCLI